MENQNNVHVFATWHAKEEALDTVLNLLKAV